MKESKRDYNVDTTKNITVRNFFHNYEHDPEGRKHCTGPISHPYVIEHAEGRKHKISHAYAKGHGKHRKAQWFKFTKKLDNGWDLASGVPVEGPPEGFLIKSKKSKKRNKQ